MELSAKNRVSLEGDLELQYVKSSTVVNAHVLASEICIVDDSNKVC